MALLGILFAMRRSASRIATIATGASFACGPLAATLSAALLSLAAVGVAPAIAQPTDGRSSASVIGQVTAINRARAYTYDTSGERIGSVRRSELDIPAPVVGAEAQKRLVLVMLSSAETVWLSLDDVDADVPGVAFAEPICEGGKRLRRSPDGMAGGDEAC